MNLLPDPAHNLARLLLPDFVSLLQPSLSFLLQVEQVQLSTKYPSVTICREKFNDIIRKGESSATRVIRMIMKHFFEPEVLAVSSLSGTGQYKEVLDPTVVNAIKGKL